MSEGERRALRRASALLLLASLGRWAWAAAAPDAPVGGAEVAAELLEASEARAASDSARARPLAEGERLDPNRATEDELDRLPGVGPATARAIVRARERGGFLEPEDLLGVRGVGSATLERIRPHLDLSRGPPARLGAARPPVGSARGKIDVNRADEDALQALPGVGPALARRIVEARRLRPFDSVEDLARVSGIGPATVERIRPLVSLGPRSR